MNKLTEQQAVKAILVLHGLFVTSFILYIICFMAAQGGGPDTFTLIFFKALKVIVYMSAAGTLATIICGVLNIRNLTSCNFLHVGLLALVFSLSLFYGVNYYLN